MSVYVAAYDVGDNKRRERLVRVLLHYGHRIQESVFQVWLEPSDLSEFRLKVGSVLSQVDQFDLFPVDQRKSRTQWRWQRPITDYDSVIIIE